MSAATHTVVPGLLSLLTGFAGGAAALFAKEFVAPIFLERRTRRKQQQEILRNYMAPLYLACNKLLWRYKEVFIDDRHQFFLTTTRPLDYNRYKRTSTIYRLASVIGWIRAIDLELSALPQRAARAATPLQTMIDEFQRALADGPDVEMFRLRQVCNIWNIDLAELSERGCEDLAAKFEVALYQLAGDSLSEDKQFDPAMSAEDRLRMCSGLSAFLASKLKRKEITDPVLRETAQRITDSLSYREALIYRDWQDAIGDAMIEKDEASTRRYRVIGFEAFEELLKHDSPWIKTLGRSVDDIDFERRDQNDFRHPQLKKLAGAVAGIVLAIDQSPDGDLVDTATANVAKRLLPAEKAA